MTKWKYKWLVKQGISKVPYGKVKLPIVQRVSETTNQ